MNRQQIKKWSLLRHLNFKGYKRTASGNPLNMVKVMFPSQLTIYGNAVQDGTPSPDAPVEVQLCGDRTGNLLDASTIYVKNSSGNVDFDGKTIHVHSNSTGEVMWFWTNVYVQQGKTYAIQYSDSTIHLRYAFSTEAITEYSSDVFANTTTIQNKFATFTATETGYLRIVFSLPVNTPDGTIDRLQVIEGNYTADTLPAYEPYGYKVSGRIEGLNLFTSDESKWQIQTYKYFKIPVDGTTTLQMKLKPGKSIPSTLYVGYTNTGYASDTGISWLIANGAYINSGVNMMSNSNGYISMYPPYLFDEMLDAFDIMLVQGSYTAETMPLYEPYQPPQDFAVYLPQQIAKVGDVADEVVVDMEKRTAELRKNVGSAAFTGDEDWYTNREPTDTQNYFVANLTSKKVNESLSSLSSHFVSTTANILALNEAKVQSFVNGTAWYGACVDSAVYPDIASFKQFVTEQYSKGNPLTVYHAIEPVTTDITSLQQWDAMPNIEGTVSITFDSTIPISNAEAEYHSKEYDAT